MFLNEEAKREVIEKIEVIRTKSIELGERGDHIVELAENQSWIGVTQNIAYFQERLQGVNEQIGVILHQLAEYELAGKPGANG